MTQHELRETLRQMLAVLQTERHALAGLDLDAIVGASVDKNKLCGQLEDTDGLEIDEECLGMLDAAKRLNEVNRQVRNLIAANVQTRLNALMGQPSLYKAGPAYAYAGGRA